MGWPFGPNNTAPGAPPYPSTSWGRGVCRSRCGGVDDANMPEGGFDSRFSLVNLDDIIASLPYSQRGRYVMVTSASGPVYSISFVPGTTSKPCVIYSSLKR